MWEIKNNNKKKSEIESFIKGYASIVIKKNSGGQMRDKNITQFIISEKFYGH